MGLDALSLSLSLDLMFVYFLCVSHLFWIQNNETPSPQAHAADEAPQGSRGFINLEVFIILDPEQILNTQKINKPNVQTLAEAWGFQAHAA